MEVRSRLSDKSTSSQEHSADKSDSSLTNEDETITKTQYVRQTEIGARRKNVMFTPEEDKYLKAGLKRYGRIKTEKRINFGNNGIVFFDRFWTYKAKTH